MFSVIVFLYNYIAQRLMKKSFLIISIFSSFILLSGCTYNEIETKANQAGNVLGRLLRGASNGLVEGFSRQDQNSND